MKKILTALCVVLALLSAPFATASGISDNAVGGYWGADGHGYGDVIGSSTYDISGAAISRVGSLLTVTIATNFAGHAGMDSNVVQGGVGYGDLFLAEAWNPFGTNLNHSADNAANGTRWSYGLNLDNRYSNTGGSFKLYALNGATNANNILNSESVLTCKTGVNCVYRNGQATAVKTASSTVKDTGLLGSWKVANNELKFTIDIASSADLMTFESFAMHWGETCQNDVIEGVVRMVPIPGTIPLVGLGLCALIGLSRRRGAGKMLAA